MVLRISKSLRLNPGLRSASRRASCYYSTGSSSSASSSFTATAGASSSSTGSGTSRIQRSSKPTTASSESLQHYLAETIKATGPITLAAYMRQCLTSPIGGYYINKDPFGVSGDFITSPEISQMFGELVGVWVLTQWLAQGYPSEFQIVEYGPGRGTLMDDLLRASKSFQDFSSALKEIHLVEASPTLREIQRKQLCNVPMVATQDGYRSVTKQGIPIFWYETSKDVPNDKPSFIIAHEFFDALPIHKFEHTDKGWRELLVDYSIPQGDKLPNQTKSTDKPTFHLTQSPNATASSKIVPSSHPRYAKLPVGSKIEVCPEAWEIAAEMSSAVEKNGGAALIIDYGSSTIPVDSLRGIKDHKIVSPFEGPGEADLSTDVDFKAIKSAAMKDKTVDVHGPVMQGDWLHAMGIGARATQLVESQPDSDKEGKKRIEQAYNRLVEKSGGAMGKVYKVLSIVPRGHALPVGFGGDVQ